MADGTAYSERGAWLALQLYNSLEKLYCIIRQAGAVSTSGLKSIIMH